MPDDPILIDCEGGAHHGHLTGWNRMMCAVCGVVLPPRYRPPESPGACEPLVMPEHQRQDLIAMIARGDFDA